MSTEVDNLENIYESLDLAYITWHVAMTVQAQAFARIHKAGVSLEMIADRYDMSAEAARAEVEKESRHER
jgi:hypothetical protein